MKINIFKNIVLAFLIVLFIQPISSCTKVHLTEEVPSCIKRKIRKGSKGGLASVTKYDYKNSEIYQFYNFGIKGVKYIFDADCNELCSNLDLQSNTLCKEILDIATNGRVIWVKE